MAHIASPTTDVCTHRHTMGGYGYPDHAAAEFKDATATEMIFARCTSKLAPSI